MYGFLFVYEDSAKRRYERSLTDCLMLSIKRKGKKKSRDPDRSSLLFLYSFTLQIRMYNVIRADHANGCSSRYSYVLHNHL